MVLGRREISAVVLASGALLFYVVFLLSGQSGAQINGEEVFFDETIIEEDTFIDDNIQEDVVVEVNRDRKPIKQQPTIINIPDKPLPPSGGPPLYGVVASFILAGTGLLALGIGIRRGLRR